MYTDEINSQIVIALLKAHGIRKVVANPGTTNISFVGSVQNDPWFEVYSGIDERHSAYMALGMSAESGEPVVLSCTGATASRNYFPALTEAFYRKLPVLALTSIHHMNSAGNLLPQMLDRTQQPKDTVRFSLQCPVPVTPRQIEDCVSNVNKALLELFRHGGGPVHINLETERAFSFGAKRLPDVRVIRRIATLRDAWPVIPQDAKVAVWVGSHKKFTMSEMEALSCFVKSHDSVVFLDCTSSSYTGEGSVFAALAAQQRGFLRNPENLELLPDLVIQIGEISGDYPTMSIIEHAKSIWRVGEDGEARDLFNKLTYIFEMPEEIFFHHYSTGTPHDLVYASKWQTLTARLQMKLPNLPFGNLWIASCMHDRLPQGACLHLGILNSLRTWNLFPVPPGVESSCNVGGFGIDGCISTMIGASLASPDRLFFGVFGDLAFFYDLNSLGNRHLGKNVRILLVNNGCGAEFNLSSHPASKFGEQVYDYVAAGRHFGNQSHELVKHYATDLGLKYLAASTKEDFESAVEVFLSSDVEQSVVFECFVNPKDESLALEMMGGIEPWENDRSSRTQMFKDIVPQRVKNAIKELLK